MRGRALIILRPLVGSSADPLQFADEPDVGVEDALCSSCRDAWKTCENHVPFLLQCFQNDSSKSLEGQSGTCRTAPANDMVAGGLPDQEAVTLRTKDCVFVTVVCRAGAPQGTVPPPPLIKVSWSLCRSNQQRRQSLSTESSTRTLWPSASGTA